MIHKLEAGELCAFESTLDLGYNFGAAVRGEGFCEPTSPSKSNDDDTSTITRAGMGTSPMVAMPGAYQEIERVSLRGAEHKVSKTFDQMPEAGIYIDYPDGVKGIGTGKHIIDKVYVSDCQDAVRFGNDVYSNNGDNCTFDHFHVQHCRAVCTFNNSMSMGNQFRWVRALSCENIFNINAGGKFNADWVFYATHDAPDLTKPCALLNMAAYKNYGKDANGKPLGVNFGSNNDQFRIGYVKVDSQVGSNFQLLRMASAIPAAPMFTFNGGFISADAYAANLPIIIVRNPCTINIYNFENFPRQAIIIEHDDKYPRVQFNVMDNQLAVDDVRDIISPVGSQKYILQGIRNSTLGGERLRSRYVGMGFYKSTVSVLSDIFTKKAA